MLFRGYYGVRLPGRRGSKHVVRSDGYPRGHLSGEYRAAMCAPAKLKRLQSGREWFIGGRPFLGPARSRYGDAGGNQLAGSRAGLHVLGTGPLLSYDEQGPAVCTAEHAGEGAAVELDRVEHLTALGDVHAALIRDVGVPHSTQAVDADAVGCAIAQGGPDPLVRQSAIGSDVERGELVPVRLRADQRLVVVHHGHPVGKRDAVCHLSGASVRRQQSNGSRSEVAARKLETLVIDVRVAAAVDDDVVPWVLLVRETAEVGMGHKGTVGLPAQDAPLASGHDQEAPVRQEVDAHRKRREVDLEDDLGVAVRVDSENLLRAPV